MGRYCLGLVLLFAGIAQAQVYCSNGQCYRLQPQAVAVWNGRTYTSRRCSSPSCRMCNSIEQQLAGSWQPITLESPDQQNLTSDQITDALRALELTRGDVFADVGCGDGRVLIAAARRYGCQAVGIEIDKTLAQKAYDEVKRLESEGLLSPGQVQVFHGDAVEWDIDQHGVTKGLAYLFPETLEKLSGLLAKIPLVITPFHEIPGRKADRKLRDFYVYEPRLEVPLFSMARSEDLWNQIQFK